jgi:hypothetical protein
MYDVSTQDATEICGSHNSECYDYNLLGCDAMWSGRYVPTFWRNLLPQSSGYTNVWGITLCSMEDKYQFY